MSVIKQSAFVFPTKRTKVRSCIIDCVLRKKGLACSPDPVNEINREDKTLNVDVLLNASMH